MNELAVVKTIHYPDGQRGLEIVRREDGLFSFREIKLYDIPTVGKRWKPDMGGVRGAYYATPEIAEREARAAVEWSNRYAGMTVNERLSNAGLLDRFDAAALAGDRDGLIEMLKSVALEDQAERIAQSALARYGGIEP